MHGAKHRDYFFFKDPNSTKYRRIYEEGREPKPESGVFPLDLALANAHIADIGSGGDIKETGLSVVVETSEQVEQERERIKAERIKAERERREEAQRKLEAELAAQQEAEEKARAEGDTLERGVNERDTAEQPTAPTVETTPPTKKRMRATTTPAVSGIGQ